MRLREEGHMKKRNMWRVKRGEHTSRRCFKSWMVSAGDTTIGYSLPFHLPINSSCDSAILYNSKQYNTSTMYTMMILIRYLVEAQIRSSKPSPLRSVSFMYN